MSAESSTEQGKEEGQKQKGYILTKRPKKTDKVNAESSTKVGKMNTSLQGQKNKANPREEKRQVISDSQYSKG